MEDSAILVSPMSCLELDFLHEIGRLNVGSDTILKALELGLDISIDEAPFPSIIEQAKMLTWTRDPFDRIIMAHSLFHTIPLITHDQLMLKKHKLARS